MTPRGRHRCRGARHRVTLVASTDATLRTSCADIRSATSRSPGHWEDAFVALTAWAQAAAEWTAWRAVPPSSASSSCACCAAGSPRHHHRVPVVHMLFLASTPRAQSSMHGDVARLPDGVDVHVRCRGGGPQRGREPVGGERRPAGPPAARHPMPGWSYVVPGHRSMLWCYRSSCREVVGTLRAASDRHGECSPLTALMGDRLPSPCSASLWLHGAARDGYPVVTAHVYPRNFGGSQSVSQMPHASSRRPRRSELHHARRPRLPLGRRLGAHTGCPDRYTVSSARPHVEAPRGGVRGSLIVAVRRLLVLSAVQPDRTAQAPSRTPRPRSRRRAHGWPGGLAACPSGFRRGAPPGERPGLSPLGRCRRARIVARSFGGVTVY